MNGSNGMAPASTVAHDIQGADANQNVRARFAFGRAALSPSANAAYAKCAVVATQWSANFVSFHHTDAMILPEVAPLNGRCHSFIYSKLHASARSSDVNRTS
jgi:hypothetical protein